MTELNDLVHITTSLFLIQRIYSREHDHALYIPFEQDGEEYYITHSDRFLIQETIPEGFVIGSVEENTFTLFEKVEHLTVYFMEMNQRDMDILRERIDIALDVYLAYNLHQIKQTELVLDDEGRADRVYKTRVALEKFFLANKEKMNLPDDFLLRTKEVPKKPEKTPQFTVVEEEVDE